MPRESSKCKSWEKDRRERLNKAFEELAKVLPSYDPSINKSKNDILKQAQETISELKEEIHLLTSSNEENATFKDKQVKKLQERIKKLLIRNEQLTNLFKNAGIKPPTVVGSVNRFRKRGKWSNRFPQQSKDLQKKEKEKENVSANNPQTKPKRTKLVSTNQVKSSKTIKTPSKIQKLKKPNKKVSLTNNLLLFSQIPTVPAVNQQLVFVPNTPVHNTSRGSSLLTVQTAKPVKSTKPKALNPINLNLRSSTLGPGTLILGNGNIISLLPQPQLMIPPLTMASQTVVFSKVINNSKSNGKTFIQSNSCITKTTQINKVPIPALTSKYANTSFLLNNSKSVKKISKKQVKIVKGDIVKSTKRKANDEDKIEPKKSKTEVKISNEINKSHKNTEILTSEGEKNKENTVEKEKIPIKAKTITSNENDTESSIQIEIADKQNEKLTESNQILEKSESINISASNNQISEKSVESASIITSCDPSKEIEVSNKTEAPSAVSSTSSVTSTLSVSVHEDAMKNIDLNLVHSDLSNDIFASLQVPPGCQNAESTSPTAAFLLAFPLVSSIKVTEVIDEENSDSQRETPTLLQIGTIDTTKPNHNDNLLNLDNFPFFNSKDICASYYNSKVDTNTNNKNAVSTQNSKLENQNFNIYVDNNTIFSKSDSHILEPKSNASKPQKLNEAQNHINSVLNNPEYVLYEEKSKNISRKDFKDSYEIFSKSSSHILEFKSNNKAQKLNEAQNHISSVLNSQEYVLYEEKSKNISRKDFKDSYEMFSKSDSHILEPKSNSNKPQKLNEADNNISSVLNNQQYVLYEEKSKNTASKDVPSNTDFKDSYEMFSKSDSHILEPKSNSNKPQKLNEAHNNISSVLNNQQYVLYEEKSKNAASKDVLSNTNFKDSYEMFSKSDSHILESKSNSNKPQKLNEADNNISSVLNNQQYVLYEEKSKNAASKDVLSNTNFKDSYEMFSKSDSHILEPKSNSNKPQKLNEAHNNISSVLNNQQYVLYEEKSKNAASKDVLSNTNFKDSYEMFSKSDSHILESKSNSNKPQKLNEADNNISSVLNNQQYVLYEEKSKNTSTKDIPSNTHFKDSYEMFSKSDSHILEPKNKAQKLNEAQNHMSSVLNNQKYVLYEEKSKNTSTKDIPSNTDFKVSYELFSKSNSHILESKNNSNKPQKLIEANNINSVLNNQQFILYEEKSKNTSTKDIPSNTDFKVSYEIFSKSDSHILDPKTNANKPQQLNETQNHTNHINSMINNQQYVLYEEKQQNVSDTKFKNFQQKSENQMVQIMQDKKVSNNASYTETSINKLQIANFNIPQENTLQLPVSISNKYNLSDNIVYKNNYSEKDQIQMNKQLDNENTANQMQYIFKSSKDANNECNSNNKIITNPQKQSTTFSLNPVKGIDITNQNIENCNNKTNNKPNEIAFHYNPFETVKTSKELVDNNCSKPANNIVNKDKIGDIPKRINDVSPKAMDATTPCYFSSNYSSTPGYKSDFSKPCTYDNQRNYSNPFYTNCNYSYNYSDTNINQNYYKPDAKSCYSLNYENYQEYRKTDIPRETKKEKPVIQNKTVNWMTEQKSQTSDCFLPSFTNQSYSFTSCISSDTTDVNPSDIKKTVERFSWSPTKLPNFLEPPHNFITPTLPTLVGDLALGNSLTVDAKNDYKYSKEPKRKTNYDNQVNFLSVSQLVNQSKIDNSPARTTTRRLSGSKSKSMIPAKNKRIDKTTVKPVNNNFDVFYEQKNRSSNKNLSSYSAEALIGNQNIQETKKSTDNTAKPICSSNFLTENIVPYFTTVDDGYMNQNQNFHNTYTHNSFQNNSYTGNSFIYTTPSISSSYLSSNFDSTHDYSTDNVMNYKNCGNKNYRITNKEEKNISYLSNIKKSKNGNQTNNALGNFEYPLLLIQGSTNSPILLDYFQSHATFLPPTAPYRCKNSLYQKQGNEFNAAVQTAKPVKSTKPKALNPINLNLRSSTLGPGTLILGNGNIISLLPQPQLIIPPLTMASQTVVFSKVINNSKSNGKTFIQSNSCITKTTQINKVPIPALTSKYANTSFLLNNSKSVKKISKKQVKIVKGDIVKSTKRKANDEDKIEPKKSKTEVKISNEIDKSHKNTEILTSEGEKNKENTVESEKILIEAKIITSNENDTESSIQIEIADKQSEKLTESNQILKKSESINISVPNNQICEKSVESASIITSCDPSKEIEVSNNTKTPSAVSSTSSVTSTLSVSVHEDAMKNIDLNLVHSDLSNDIFASLQVPPGCQNAESISPTAAFLLAFPLVSSIKVTEVIDEENSDSQRETPTLLQIGTMDTSKPSHNDNLLNLDNFPFFNSKDICASYYNSKMDTNTNNKNAVSTQNSKLENQNFNMYVDNNTIFSKSDSHILEPKSNASKPQKLNEAQNHINSVLNNQEYVSYEEKSKNIPSKDVTSNTDFKDSYEIFSKSNSHILESKSNLNKAQKLNEAQNHINSVLNSQEYVLYEEKSKNISRKDVTSNTDFKDSFEIFSKSNSHILEPKSNSNKPQKLNEADNNISSVLNNQQYVLYEEKSKNTARKDVPSNTDFKDSYEMFSKSDSQILEPKSISNKLQKLNEADNNINSVLNNQQYVLYEDKSKNTTSKDVPSNNDFKNSFEMFSKSDSHILEPKNKAQKLNEAQNHMSSVLNNQKYVLYEEKSKNTSTKDIPSNTDFKVSYELFSKSNSHILESKSNSNKPQKLNEANNINSVLNNQQYIVYEEKSKNTSTKDIPSNTDFKVSYEIFSKSDSHILDSKTNANKPQQLNETQNHTNHINSMINNQQYVLYEEKQQNVTDTKFKNFQHKSENQMVQIMQDKKVSNNASYTETSTNKLQIANFNIPQENTLQLPVSISNKYNLSDNIVYKNNYIEKDVQIQMNKQLDNENTTNQMQYIFKSSKDANNEFNSNNKIITNPQKQSTTFSLNPVKGIDITNQNIENCNNKSNNKPNEIAFHYNPFETVKAAKEIDNNCSKSANNIVNKDKIGDIPKRINDVSPKAMDTTTPCYFSSNYSSTPGYKSDFSKPCTYDNQRNYSNPFYTNCNYSYNYSDTNINQNYYKPDAKSCYSLNYENYQEYRKTDIPREAKKEKPVIQNKTVNWMTEQKSQTSDCFLPSFTNQSYSFTSCISSDTTDVNPSDIKKTVERFSWSPTKLPNFLEPPHNFITPTLPTLVGDLALGNSLTVDAKNDYKYSKEPKRKTNYDNQVNFLSVSQLVNQNKTDNSPARTTTRRLSGSKSKSMIPAKNKRIDKTTVKPVNNNFDVFYEQKNRSSNKNLSSYSAEALIGNQNIQETKKCTENTAKPICSSNFLTENIVPYFTTVDDGYMNQNQNFHNTYTHNSFQNNSYSGNSFIYTTPSISSSYLSSNFDSTHDYSTDNVMNYKNCGNKNYRITNKEEKNISYPSNIKKSKKGNQTNNALGNFEYPLLPIQGSTNSPILPDDFQSHATFLPPTAPYPCKNPLYQKQGNEFNAAGPLLPPLPGITRNNIQHPQVSPSLNNAGTSLTNFNLSTIFPEINKGQIPNAISTSNKTKNNSTYLEGSFNADPKYNFSG